MTWKKATTVLISVVLLIGAIIAIGKTPYFSTVFNRMNAMIMTLDENTSIEEGSTEARKEFIEEGFNTFLNHPVVGIGLNNSGIITEKIISRKTYLHCNYVEVLACLGIIGFVLYYAIYIGVVIKTISLNKGKTNRNYLPIIIAFTLLAVEIGCVTYYEIKTAMYFIIMIVMLYKQNWTDAEFLEQNNVKYLIGDIFKDKSNIIDVKD